MEAVGIQGSATGPQARPLPPVLRISLRVWLKLYAALIASARPVFDLVVRLVIDDRVTERLRERGLARARVILEEDVTVREQRDEDELDHVVAAHHVLAHVRVDLLRDATGAVERGDRGMLSCCDHESPSA